MSTLWIICASLSHLYMTMKQNEFNIIGLQYHLIHHIFINIVHVIFINIIYIKMNGN